MRWLLCGGWLPAAVCEAASAVMALPVAAPSMHSLHPSPSPLPDRDPEHALSQQLWAFEVISLVV